MNAIKIKATRKRRPRFVFVKCAKGHIHVCQRDESREACDCGGNLRPDKPLKIKVKERKR